MVRLNNDLCRETKGGKAGVIQYNYKLDTSNFGESVEEYELRHQAIKDAWVKITLLLVEKGKKIRFKYWPGDIVDGNNSYSGYGINKQFYSRQG